MKKYIDQLNAFADTVGVPMITPELEVLSYLYEQGPVSSRKLMGVSRLSPAGFHILRKRLVDLHLIVGRKCDQDSRKTLYDISPSLRVMFETMAAGAAKRPSSEIGRAA